MRPASLGVRLGGIYRNPMTKKIPLSEEDLKRRLTPEQYHILREKGTEAPFSSSILDSKEKGMYACAVCGQALFSSDAKYDSRTGWPSFDQSLPGAVEYFDDSAFGTRRIEVRCSRCGSHLGHLFEDGPQNTTGKRYCINGACLVMKEGE